jgi:hypothetical protein
LEHVVKAGDWISTTDINRAEDAKPRNGLPGLRWDRIYAALPDCLHSLIESKTGAGYRLLPTAWRK